MGVITEINPPCYTVARYECDLCSKRETSVHHFLNTYIIPTGWRLVYYSDERGDLQVKAYCSVEHAIFAMGGVIEHDRDHTE